MGHSRARERNGGGRITGNEPLRQPGYVAAKKALVHIDNLHETEKGMGNGKSSTDVVRGSAEDGDGKPELHGPGGHHHGALFHSLDSWPDREHSFL